MLCTGTNKLIGIGIYFVVNNIIIIKYFECNSGLHLHQFIFNQMNEFLWYKIMKDIASLYIVLLT